MAKPKKGKKKKKVTVKKKKVTKKRIRTPKPEVSIYRKVDITPPEGFALVEAVEDNINQARQKIHKVLEKTCDTIPYSCYFRTHPYPKAGEVDGELTVSNVKGVDTSDVVAAIQEAMLPDVAPDSPKYKESVLGKGFWITVGFRWQGTGDEEELDLYKKWHGMIEVSSNYRPVTSRARILSAFSVGQLPSSRNPNSMITNIERKFNRTIGQIFVRLVWNSRNAQPIRSIPDED